MLIYAMLGCVANQLSQSWQLDRLRVLGAQVEPAEPRPGETVSFTSLVYTPVESTYRLDQLSDALKHAYQTERNGKVLLMPNG